MDTLSKLESVILFILFFTWLMTLSIIWLIILPAYVPSLLYVFFGLSLALGFFFFSKKMFGLGIIYVIIGFIAVYFVFSVQAVPEKTFLQFTLWNWDKTQDLGYTDVLLDFRKVCGDYSRGHIKLDFRNNESIKSWMGMDLPDGIEAYYLRVNRSYPSETIVVKNESNLLNSTRISLFNNTDLDVGYYMLELYFKLKDTVKPKTFFSLDVNPIPHDTFDFVSFRERFNTVGYSCDRDCDISNLVHTSVQRSNYVIECRNAPYSWINPLGLESSETSIGGESRTLDNKDVQVDRIFFHVNVEDTGSTIFSNLVWGILLGLVIILIELILSYIKDLHKNVNRPEEFPTVPNSLSIGSGLNSLTSMPL